VILLMQGRELGSYLEKVFSSADPFDVWFANELREVHGIEPSQPGPVIEHVF
jgi:hypothetical protein